MPSTDSKYAATTWAAPTEFDFECPSGQVCRMKRMDPTDLVAAGILGKMDWLTATVLNEHIPNGRKTAMEKAKDAKTKVGQKQKTPEEQEAEIRQRAYEELLKSPEKLADFKKILNDVLLMVVVQPTLYPIPQPKDNEPAPVRDPEKVYVDMVEFTDKMAIFNRATKGVSDLDQFREGSEEAVGALAPSQDVRKSPKRSAGRK